MTMKTGVPRGGILDDGSAPAQLPVQDQVLGNPKVHKLPKLSDLIPLVFFHPLNSSQQDVDQESTLGNVNHDPSE